MCVLSNIFLFFYYMTFTRKNNIFGGTQIHIYLGNKTKKTNSNLPIVRGGGNNESTESGSTASGSTESETSTDVVEGNIGEVGKGTEVGTKNAPEFNEDFPENAPEFNENPPVNAREHNYETKEEPGIENAVSTLLVEEEENDKKIDQIEVLLTKNWSILYDKLGTITPDNVYTQTDKSELTQLIQEMVAVALLQTI